MRDTYRNTKENNVHYKGKVWVTKGDRLGKNICLDWGKDGLRVIAFVPEVNDETVTNAIKSMGYRVEDWM